MDEYKRRHNGHMDATVIDAIDNVIEVNFTDEMLGEYTNQHTVFQTPTEQTRSLANYLGVPVQSEPSPIVGILNGSESGTAETEETVGNDGGGHRGQSAVAHGRASVPGQI